MVRRLKRDITDKFQNPLFPARQIQMLEVDYTDEERQLHRWLREYHQLRSQHARTNDEHFAAEFVLKLLKKRLLSSPEAFRKTLEKHIETIRNGATKRTEVIRPTTGILKRQIAQADEDYANDQEFEAANEGALHVAASTFSPPTSEELRLLEQMMDAARRASEQGDSKTE